MPSVRGRTTEDLSGCVRALREVHGTDGYPAVWPASPSDWLNPPGCCAAWVAMSGNSVIGHVCLIRGVDDPLVTALTGGGPDRLAAVSRLFVAPSSRGHHVGADLLAALSGFASEKNLQLMLDVVDDESPAVALYERLGWQLVDRRRADWATPDGRRLPLRVYLAPSATCHGSAPD